MKAENRGIWKEEIPIRDFKHLTPTQLRKFGLERNIAKEVDSLEELTEQPPNIIICEGKSNFKFIQNYFKEQEIRKRVKYVMGLGVFQQLQYSTGNKKLLTPTSVKFKNIYRPYKGQDIDNKSILIFRTGGIGDLLFIQPNLIYLKEKYPTCEIKFACGPQYQPMVETWDCVDEVLDLPFTFKSLVESDYHVLFEGVIERCKEARMTNAYNLFSRWMGLDLPDHLLIPKQNPVPELIDECQEIIDQMGLSNKPFVIMQLRASSPIRTPRHGFWVNIIDELNRRGYNVVLTDNPRQTDNIDSFIKLVNNPSMTFNFCKYSKSIAYSIALAKIATGVISTDSALSHIAASLNVPCFGIFGPFPGFIRLKTYPKASWVDAKRSCAPCFIHSPQPCPKANPQGYSPCYDELIDTDEKLKDLIDKFEELVND
ncbi:MAG: glycosyltransferase family 9 protein [Candidatus Helarchaeota archaeon]